MKYNRWILTVCLGILFLGSTVMAQTDSPEVTVIPPEIPELRWGEQTVTFDVTNNTDYLRFIVLQQTLNALPIAAILVIVVWIWRLRLLRALHETAAGAGGASNRGCTD